MVFVFFKHSTVKSHKNKGHLCFWLRPDENTVSLYYASCRGMDPADKLVTG